MGVLSWQTGHWVGIQEDGGAGRSGPPLQVAIVPEEVLRKGLIVKFLGGRVRASKPNTRCWVQNLSRSAGACPSNGMSF